MGIIHQWTIIINNYNFDIGSKIFHKKIKRQNVCVCVCVRGPVWGSLCGCYLWEGGQTRILIKCVGLFVQCGYVDATNKHTQTQSCVSVHIRNFVWARHTTRVTNDLWIFRHSVRINRLHTALRILRDSSLCVPLSILGGQGARIPRAHARGG